MAELHALLLTPSMLSPTCLFSPRNSRSLLVAALALFPAGLRANELTAASAKADPTAEWAEVRPLLEKNCYECHGGKKTKGGTDLKKLDGDPAVAKEFSLWSKVKESVHLGEMPPDEHEPLAAADKERLMQWLGRSLDTAAKANAGDPGIVTIRRLTNAEYDYSIRDLTGIDYGVGREFSPDGGGGEGFSNIGDVLFVSPQQLDKYLTAARKLTDHTTILPGAGITFQKQRVGLRGPEQLRDQAEQALYVWYQKMSEPFLPQDFAAMRMGDYMVAAWQWKHRGVTGAQSLAQLAKDAGLMLPFLENWWALLNNEKLGSRYLDLTRVAWRDLPPPDAAQPQAVPPVVREKVAAIETERRSWLGPDKNPGGGVQRRQQDSDGIQSYEFRAEVRGKPMVHVVLGDVADGNTGDWVTFHDLMIEAPKRKVGYHLWLKTRLNADKEAIAKPAADTALLEKRIAEAEAVLAKFGKDPRGQEAKLETLVVQAPTVITLPLPDDAVTFRGKGKLDIDGPDADQASVQWTATADAPPDPTKVLAGALTVWKRGGESIRKLGHEFGIMKVAFPDEHLRRLEEISRNFLRGGTAASVYYFSDAQLTSLIAPEEKARWEKMMIDWRLVRNKTPNAQQAKEWDEALQRHLGDFASRAWRRNLEKEDIDQLAAVYAAARGRDLDRESAAREVLVRVLVSPNFLFKLEDASQPGEHRLNPWEFATRLSYFLWASPPDEALRRTAADGSIFQSEILQQQVRRMLRDWRAVGLAEEFAGQWLEFHGFAKSANVDPKKFPEFTPELKRDLQREVVEFFTHLVREDRPVGEILTADYTFLNARLADFYDLPAVKGEGFQKVSVAGQPRGGVLGMGAILTKTSYPHRTSPVLRGHWLLHSILGTPTPPPPPDVPQLDDSASKATTLRARLEAHRADKACATCHDKIDPLGFALEAFDAIGRVREKDEAGQPIDDSAQIKNGPQFTGLGGLRTYLATRETEFTDLLNRKLLGYALGRTILPSDKTLLETMRAEMKKSGGHFSTAVLAIAQSRQFQNRRNE